jgi:membrane fusion protein, copper/silver efflux system
MKRQLSPALMLVLAVGAFSAGSYYGQQGDVQPAAGMSSVATRAPEGLSDARRGAAALSPAPVSLGDDKRQLVGVRSSPVEKVSETRTLRVLGRVAPDETRVYRLNAGTDGFIGEVSPATTGSAVKKNQELATFSAPSSIQIIQQYILVLGAKDRVKQATIERSVEAQAGPLANSNYQQRSTQLRNIGMSVLQMEEIERTREVPESIKILAPVDGFVLARNVSSGLRFDRGAEWYRIADLNRVWVLADVFRHEARYLRPGARAWIKLPDGTEMVSARVAEVLPQFDSATRTLKVRLEADNPGFVLRPDMFVDVEVPVTLPATIAVPTDAVIDAGLTKTVFVDRGDGSFEARPVETGWRFGDRVEIVKGLASGERIVVTGTFLLDSESRMRSTAGPTAHGGHAHGAAVPAGPEKASSSAGHGHAGHDDAAHDQQGHDHGGHR